MYAQSAALLPDEGFPALRVFQDAIRAALRNTWICEHALREDRTGEAQHSATPHSERSIVAIELNHTVPR